MSRLVPQVRRGGRCPACPAGFTLLELVVVLVVLAVIVAIAVPRFSSILENSKYESTHAGFRNIVTALDLYHADHGGFPPNSGVQVMPPELDGYLRPSVFTRPTPFGRGWDWNGAGSGINSHGINLSIHTTVERDRAEMERRFDDGDPNSGLYRTQSHYLLWPVGP